MKTHSKEILVGGDFNAKGYLWGPNGEDARGKLLTEWLGEENLIVHNQGNTPTFVRNDSESFIDITFSTKKLAQKVVNWKVLEEESLSFHKYISFEIQYTNLNSEHTTINKGWRLTEGGMKKLVQEVGRRFEKSGAPISPEELNNIVVNACDRSFAKKSDKNRKPVYWWTEKVANCRKECIKQRRAKTRANRTNDEAQKNVCKERFKESRRALKKAILEAKNEAWKKVIKEVDDDLWGKGYRIVTGKLQKIPPLCLSDEQQLDIADKLFPTKRVAQWIRMPTNDVDIPLFTLDELVLATAKLKEKKAGGPDRLPPEVVKTVVKEYPQKCLQTMNSILAKGEFPKIWKIAKLVLIEKAKPGQTEKSYRPLCLLNVFGKLLEQAILGRLKKEIERTGGLSPEQYGFQEKRSTTQAIQRAQEIADEANERVGRKRCALVTLDVQNAFNSAPWEGILQEMRRRNFAPYVYNIIASYLENRILIVGESKTMRVTCGVPQGSVIGPILWNLYYDGVLRIQTPAGVTLVGYADDLAIVTVAKDAEALQEKTNETIETVTNWMRAKELRLAPHKTEVVLLAAGRKIKNITVTVENSTITSQNNLKYLGVHLDRNMYMGYHVRKIAEKANKAIGNISRIMPNVGGPKESNRQILCSVVNSIMLYGAVTWQRAMKKKIYRNILYSVQRRAAIRIVSAYRTTSTKALLVIARTPPIDLLVEERVLLSEEENKNEARRSILDKWQSRWEINDGKAEWTRRLIPDIRPWVNRKVGQVNYHLTQLLTGHGGFRSYLHYFKLSNTEECLYCGSPDTPEHTFFECGRWTVEKGLAERTLGQITPDNIVTKMLENEENWKTISNMATSIMTAKRKDM